MKIPEWFKNIPIWGWAMLVAAIVLTVIIVVYDKSEICTTTPKSSTDCNVIVDNYNECENKCGEWRIDCKELYIPLIVDCYGNQLLADQMALENSTR